MNCRSCLWSEWSPLRAILWCRKFWKPARMQCVEFVYEPGTDAKDAPTDGAAQQ